MSHARWFGGTGFVPGSEVGHAYGDRILLAPIETPFSHVGLMPSHAIEQTAYVTENWHETTLLSVTLVRMLAGSIGSQWISM